MLLILQDGRIQGRDPPNHRWIKRCPPIGAHPLHQRDTCRLLVSPCVSCASHYTARITRPGYHGNAALIVYRRPTSNNRGRGSTRSRGGISGISWTTTTGSSPTVGVATEDKSIKGIKAAVLPTNSPHLNVQRRHRRGALIVSFFSGIIRGGPGLVLLNSRFPFRGPAA